MHKSDYLKNATLNANVGGAALPAVPTFYVGLFTTTPASDGTGGVEVSGGGYARKAVTNNTTNFPTTSSGTKSNAADIQWTAATADWGTVAGVAIFDAPTGGNQLYQKDLTTPRAVGTDIAFTFRAGSLTFTEA